MGNALVLGWNGECCREVECMMMLIAQIEHGRIRSRGKRLVLNIERIVNGCLWDKCIKLQRPILKKVSRCIMHLEATKGME